MSLTAASNVMPRSEFAYRTHNVLIDTKDNPIGIF